VSVLKIAFTGCGDIAQYMAWLARFNRRIQIVACCDRDLEKARAFARRFRIPQAYDDYSKLLVKEDLGALYLAVPHHLHHDMLAEAIQAGVPTLVEKPITRTLQEGRQVVALAEQGKTPVGVNYQYRYDAGCYALAMAVRAGALGRVHYARCNLAWHRERDYFEQSGWHAQLETAGGGTLITQGSHLLDAALWALNEKPVNAMGNTRRRVFREVEVEDLAQGVLALESGALLQISSAMVANPEQPLSIEVYGEHGTALYSDKPLPHVRFRGVRVRKDRPPVWGVHALQRSLEAFRRWVVEGKPYLTPARASLPALAAVEALYRSAKSGQREAVESCE
jgi:UDP-N-acetyl-2-amino-2-deoxyglucuronate dehydrogenase